VNSLKRRQSQFRRAVRIRTHRDVEYRIGDRTLLLPPEHWLPTFQEAYPLYDRYFLDFLGRLADKVERLCVYDIGGNVGDTATAILSVAPDAKVVCVEGSEYFLAYLHRNVAGRDNVEVMEGFVTHRPGNWTLSSDGSTGHLVETADDVQDQAQHLTVADILGRGDRNAVRIWKSDTDGFDIPTVLGAFDDIAAACAIIWMEFDPLINTSGPEDVRALLDKIGELDRDVVLYDNFGHRMLHLPGREGVVVIEQLNRWLAIQANDGARRIGYFDLWVLPSELADLMCE